MFNYLPVTGWIEKNLMFAFSILTFVVRTKWEQKCRHVLNYDLVPVLIQEKPDSRCHCIISGKWKLECLEMKRESCVPPRLWLVVNCKSESTQMLRCHASELTHFQLNNRTELHDNYAEFAQWLICQQATSHYVVTVVVTQLPWHPRTAGRILL